MLKRVITGAVLIVITVGFFLLRNINAAYFNIYIFFMIAVGTYEMIRAFGDRLSMPEKGIISICALLLVPGFMIFDYFFGSGSIGIAAIAVGGVCVLMIVNMMTPSATLDGMGLALLCMAYPSLLLSTMLIINDLPLNSDIGLLFVFIISPITDTSAFLVGSAFKGRKLLERISPKKTLSGAIGGLIGGALSSLVMYFIFKNSFVYDWRLPAWLLFILVGVGSSIMDQIGDLIESNFKRKLCLKDMGSIFPGHGGMLDRIDGMIFNSCFIFTIFRTIII